jgi:hypothetical protein
VTVLDPDTYYECGSGSRNVENDQNLHKKKPGFLSSKRLLYLRRYVVKIKRSFLFVVIVIYPPQRGHQWRGRWP